MALKNCIQKSTTCYKRAYPKILEYADEHRDEGFCVDVTVVADEVTVPANKLILSCYSKVFERIFKAQKKESNIPIVNINSVNGESIKALINFMYKGSITITNDNVVGLLAGAEYLEMEEVKEFCVQFLETILTPSSCYAIFGVANQFKLEMLQNKIYQLISARFDVFAQTDDFKMLSKEDVFKCVSKLDRSRVNDIAIYQMIVVWTKHDEQRRKDFFPGLLQLIDLNKLPKEFLENVLSKEKLIREYLESASVLMSSVFKHWGYNKFENRGSKILSVGGINSPNKMTELYNFNAQPISTFPQLPTNLECGWALKLNDYIYYGGGKNLSFNQQTVVSNRVIRMKLNDLTFEEVASMSQPRYGPSAAIFNDLLVVTGGSSIEKTSSAECYIPQLNEWRFIAPTNLAKDSNALVCCKGSLYDTGGWNGSTCFNDVERLEGIKESWCFVQPMQTRRMGHSAVACEGFVYAMGGQSEKGALNSVEKYDPSLNTWVFVQKMNFVRYGHAAGVIGGKIYVVGGENEQGAVVKEIECYDPTGDAWCIVGHTNDSLFNHSLVVV